MKVYSSLVITFVSTMVFTLVSSAQTEFTDADINDSFITTAGNWSLGLPTNGVTGTIGMDAKYDAGVTLIGYDVVHTNGILAKGTGISAFPLTAGSSYVMDGVSAQLRGRGINVNDSSFTLNQGLADLTENTRDSQINGGGVVIMNGGMMDIGRHLYVISGDLTVNSGWLINIQDLGARNFHAGGNANLNGGTITATYLTFGTGGFDVNFGGTTAGSLTITNFGGGRANVNLIDIDFAPGTLMSMQLTDPVESGASGDGDLGWSDVGSESGLDWAPALWANGRLTYNEQDYTTLGDWATVSSPGGLGDNKHFDFDGSTLSLATVEGTVLIVR